MTVGRATGNSFRGVGEDRDVPGTPVPATAASREAIGAAMPRVDPIHGRAASMR
jgi:hypothetical protein